MIAEIVAALMVGALVIGMILEPLVRGTTSRVSVLPPEPLDPEETPRGAALSALKEIEFDKATGKLSDDDYSALTNRYTVAAVEAIREEERVSRGLPGGERQDVGAPDAVEAVIAAKVRALRSASAPPAPGTAVCPTCGPRPEPNAVFCSTCGSRLPTGVSCVGCGASLPPDGKYCESCGRKVAA
jgi:hypothetical protein